MQSPRFLALIQHAQMQWLPGLSHVPISDDPRLVASLMLRFLKASHRGRGTRPGLRYGTDGDPGQLADHDAGPRQSNTPR